MRRALAFNAKKIINLSSFVALDAAGSALWKRYRRTRSHYRRGKRRSQNMKMEVAVKNSTTIKLMIPRLVSGILWFHEPCMLS